MNNFEKVLEIIRVSDPDIYNLLSDNFEFVKTYHYSIILKFKSESHKVIALLGLEQYIETSILSFNDCMYNIPLNFKNSRLCIYPNTDNTMSLYGQIT